MNARSNVVRLRNVNRKVRSSAGPDRLTNAEMRSREHLLADEVEAMLKAAKASRYPARDHAMVLLGVRHGLRAQEIADLEWSQVEFGRNACLHVRRVKGGTPSTHPLRGEEIRALRALQKEQGDGSKFVFATERGGPFTADAVNRQVKTIGNRAGLALPVHVHMLRHTCGYALANAGHDTRRIQAWLGHVSIQHTVKYTALSAAPFRDFWRD
jgi:integrase